MSIINLLSNRIKFIPNMKMRFYSSAQTQEKATILQKIRNIGILAHIDAGKTTTTERMLYYSGLINEMGEVHHGNTVTDYMHQERERGITITSAAVTFPWKKHQINLIDTPGHIDFTMEVEQTLNVLDGVVVVLDGSAGVEAQTITVWRQADIYRIPRIVFVNKMDRNDADLKMSCKSIEDKLNVPIMCLHEPIRNAQNQLIGMIDLVSLKKITYNEKVYKRENLSQLDRVLWENAIKSRNNLVEKLTEFDDKLAEIVINRETVESVTNTEFIDALRSATIQKKIVPVVVGSAYKNIGIQPLLNAILLYLPSPLDCANQYKDLGENLYARAFKVRHNKQKGPLVFFRIYNGDFRKSQKLHSIYTNTVEQSNRLYNAHANEFTETDRITNGNIAVVSGLKNINSGDLVTNSSKSKYNLLENKSIDSAAPNIPPPVFFCAIEPPSLAHQNALDLALNELQREDPSLRVRNDSETGQTIVSGMGELHLEIIKDRIFKEYKVDVEMGRPQIAYRETPMKFVKNLVDISTKIAGSRQSIKIELSLDRNDFTKQQISLDKSQEAASNLSNIYPKHLVAIKQGINVGLIHGPKISAQICNVCVTLHWCEIGRGTSETFISATVTKLVQKLLNESGTEILEPVMNVEIITPEEYLSSIMVDLTKRRLKISSIILKGDSKAISAEIPLAELIGYSTILRTISSGTASFSMEFSTYRAMSSFDEENAIRNIRGF